MFNVAYRYLFNHRFYVDKGKLKWVHERRAECDFPFYPFAAAYVHVTYGKHSVNLKKYFVYPLRLIRNVLFRN